MEEDRVVSSEPGEGEITVDTSLRPSALGDFVGQEKIKNNLRIFIEAAKARLEPLDHILLYGPPGLGKTTLAHIIAGEMGANVKATSGPVLERPGDLAAILTNLNDRDVLFVDEIHRLNRVVEELLYPAMEDFCIDIMLGEGPSARVIKLDVPRFTLVGATTRAGLLTSPLRDRFGVVERLSFYGHEELQKIVLRSARILSTDTVGEGAFEIAKRSRGTPRIANRLLRRVRDFAEVQGDGRITRQVADRALHQLEVDSLGLDHMDQRLIRTIIEKFDGGPVGVSTLSAAISEEKETIEDVYEPFLIQHGYLARTPRGRVATRIAYEHFGIPFQGRSRGQAEGKQEEMF